MSSFSDRLVSVWYQPQFHPGLIALLPLSWLVAWHAGRRYRHFRANRKTQPSSSVPVIVVGNITVGGTGKTPLVAALVSALYSRGFRPGIVSRGYGATTSQFPMAVRPGDDPALLGDEPVMLAEMTGVPVVIDPDRPAALEYLLAHNDCDVIISDDGLQHYALDRQLEILVLDGARWLGNGHCLPAGPLREPQERLAHVDFIVSNGAHKVVDSMPVETMSLVPAGLVNIRTGELLALEERHVLGQPVHAVAGIGNPDRFFRTLQSLGFSGDEQAFPDHHRYRPEDFASEDTLPVIMTSKDAIKCRQFARNNWWYLSVEARLPDHFWDDVSARLSRSPSFFRPVFFHGKKAV